MGKGEATMSVENAGDETDGSSVGACELCDQPRELSFHHLIPRHVHSKKRFQKLYSRAEMRHSGLMLCRYCHSGIHTLIPSEKELALQFNTREKLLSHPAIAKHVAWSRKQK
jgi:hypothetical protein